MKRLNTFRAIPRIGKLSGRVNAGAFLPGCLAVFLFLFHPLFAEQNVAELTYADLLFKKKDYAQAAQQYRLFVDRYPTSDAIQSGWFRLGESYRVNGQLRQARDAFQNMVDNYQSGPEVGNASFRLGMLNFSENDYSNALIDFELASREASSPKVRYQAKYYNARSLQMLQKNDLALALYDQLMRNNPGPETNHFYEKSILEAARIYSAKGDIETAYQKFQQLIETATTSTVREEAVVRGALAAVSCGNIQRGEEFLKGADQFKKNSPWEALADVGSLFVAYAKKDFEKVVHIYSSGSIINSAGEYRPKVILMVADAFRAIRDKEAAVRLYTLLEGSYPTLESGIKAGFRRLTLLYNEGGASLPTAVEKFTSALKVHSPESEFIDRAYLLLAEWHFFQGEKGVAGKDARFSRQQFSRAVDAYDMVREGKIDPKLIPTLFHHQSWASLESGDVATGAQLVTTLRERFPDSPLVPEALAKRGDTYLGIEDFTSALADFESIITHYPDSVSTELAMERRGRIFTHRRDITEIISSYETLLENFPQTKSRAEAHFWIGDSYFEEEKFREALPHLEAARRLDGEFYGNKSSIRMILCHYSLNQVSEMTKAARIYIQSARDAGVLNARQKKDKPLEIPTHVLISLGKKLYEKEQYYDAEFFLNRIVTLDAPHDTSALVWKEWAKTKLKLEKYQKAIEGFDHLLVKTSDRGERGFAYVKRAQAQFALEQFDKARISAQECMRVVNQGRINAEARLLIGDIAAEQGDLALAADEYYLVGQLFDDPNITPLALDKAIQIYRKLGAKEKVGLIEKKVRARIARQMN